MSGRHPFIMAHIDGASRGNPGPAAYGVVVESEDGARLAAFSKTLGRTTNNVAEYQALLAALEFARAHHYPKLKVLSDSELLARQLQGTYKVKSPELKALYNRARDLIAQLEWFAIQHVRREENAMADGLANQALDGRPAISRKTRPAASTPRVIRTRATYRKGVLELHDPLSFAEGEELELEIRGKP